MRQRLKSPLKHKEAYQKEQKIRRSQAKNSERKRKRNLVVGIIVLLAFAALPAVFLNSIFGYLPVLVAALLIIVSYLYVVWMKHAIVFEENSDFSNCKRGSSSGFAIWIKNKSPLVFPKLEIFFYISDLFGGEDDVTSTVITLAPFEERMFEFDVRFEHIGTYEAGLNKVVMQDLFGFFQKTLDNSSRYKVQVSPKVYDLEKLKISNKAFTESRNMLQPVSMDGSDYTGVREYVIGDPIKSIHWKLSARTEHYMTRQFESYGNSGVSIIMDFQCPLYDSESMMSVFDSVVETALSAEYYGRRNGMEAELVYINKHGARKRYITRSSTKPFDLITDLPAISAEKRRENALQLLKEEGNATYSKSNIAFCTGNVTAELARLLVEVKSHRKNPVLFVVLPQILTGDEKQKYLKPLRSLDYARIPYYVIHSVEELQGGERRVS
jgi:uncharacterized protein (DUF58 family)